MHGRVRIIAIGLLVGTILVASPALADDKSDLAARAAAWKAAFNAGDANGVAELYTEDAMRLPYQASTIKGRAAVVANIQETYDKGITKIRLEVLGAETMGNMAWGHGSYVLMDGDGNTIQEGKWLNVSKKVGGEWLTHADIWNTNEPGEEE